MMPQTMSVTLGCAMRMSEFFYLGQKNRIIENELLCAEEALDYTLSCVSERLRHLSLALS